METPSELRKRARRKERLGQWYQWQGDRAGDALVEAARLLEAQAAELEAARASTGPGVAP